MLNKAPFDKNLFDRENPLKYLEAFLKSKGSLDELRLLVLQHVAAAIRASGKIALPMVIRQFIGLYEAENISASGSMNVKYGPNDFRLQLPLTVGFSGGSHFKPGAHILVPFETNPYDILGSGNVTITDRVLDGHGLYFLLHMIAPITSTGTVAIWPLVLRIYLEMDWFGDGALIDAPVSHAQPHPDWWGLRLWLPIPIDMWDGTGWLNIRRLGHVDEDIFELENLNLLPGQTLIIDTDTMNVTINDVPNVDAVTSDSIFLNIWPGENDITFESDDPSFSLETTFSWQNRWL